MQIDISNLDKAEVLVALYNASKQQGMGFLHARGREPLTKVEAAELLKEGTFFDYLHGRVMKLYLGGDTLDTCGYDRDNGIGAAAKALAPLLTSGRSAETFTQDNNEPQDTNATTETV